MDIGVFIPIGNNGWLISKSSPQYLPSFELNKAIVQKAEEHGLDFALSMIKLKGFGGETEFWDHNLESFTLMAGLAAVTERIKLYASTPILVLPPAIVARMATTIDSIAPGRFGINIVTGWAPGEYSQMDLWPGDEHFGNRYARAAEYVNVMKELWSEGVSNFKGEFYEMDDCVLSPRPTDGHIDIVAAGQSPTGIRFAAEHAEYNFILGSGVNTPLGLSDTTASLVDAAAETGRDVGALSLFMIIADETDEAAQAKWQDYHDNADHAALAYMKPANRPPTPPPTTPPPPAPSCCPRARSTSTWARWSARTRPSRSCSTRSPRSRAPRGSCSSSTTSWRAWRTSAPASSR